MRRPQIHQYQGCGLGLDISVSRRTNVSSWSRLGKNSNVSVSSLSRLFTSRAQDVIFDQIVQATFIKWAKSVVAIYGSVNPNRLMHYLLAEVYY